MLIHEDENLDRNVLLDHYVVVAAGLGVPAGQVDMLVNNMFSASFVLASKRTFKSCASAVMDQYPLLPGGCLQPTRVEDRVYLNFPAIDAGRRPTE